MISRIKSRYRKLATERAIALEKRGTVEAKDLEFPHWQKSLEDPRNFYLKCFRFFHSHLPGAIKSHRAYFEANLRGFGEDAFHVMWFLLTRQFRIASFLEIGVYRGQVLSLISMLQQLQGIDGKVLGISPFCSVGDTVSQYLSGIDYFEDTLTNFGHFGLPEPELVKAYSTDPDALAAMHSRLWDCIYIDGNHDYEIAKADWRNAISGVRTGGLIVLDDSGLTTPFSPPPFATKGHQGPSRVAAEVDKQNFVEILQVGHNRVFQKR